jgi:hypothetical protein
MANLEVSRDLSVEVSWWREVAFKNAFLINHQNSSQRTVAFGEPMDNMCIRQLGPTFEDLCRYICSLLVSDSPTAVKTSSAPKRHYVTKWLVRPRTLM